MKRTLEGPFDILGTGQRSAAEILAAFLATAVPACAIPSYAVSGATFHHDEPIRPKIHPNFAKTTRRTYHNSLSVDPPPINSTQV
jgi:hypothetical protein